MAAITDPRGTSSEARGWLASLEAHGVQYLILDARGDEDLLREARRRPAWRVDFDDCESLIWFREATAPLPQGEEG